MASPRPKIGSELVPVLLILMCLAGTWAVLVAMQSRAPRRSLEKEKKASVALTPQAPVEPAPIPSAVSAVPETLPSPPKVPQTPAPPPEDPTEKALDQIAKAIAEQTAESARLDARARTVETARQVAVAETERWRRRELLIRSQIAALSDRAARLEADLDDVRLERDALARERDEAKASLAKARARSSYAVLPNKAQNGTWRRPIIIECHNGEATLQPNGPTFSILEISGLFGSRSAPIVAAVAREVVRAQSVSSPDGSPVVPYIFFVIRPDGIRPYYNCRAQLEPLGIAFGYELVDQGMEVDYPDLNNIEEWDGPVAPRSGRDAASPPARVVSPSSPLAAGRSRGSRPGGDPADVFVWPPSPATGPDGNGGGGFEGSGTAGLSGRSQASSGGSSRTERAPGSVGIEGGFGGNPGTPARNGLGRGGSGVEPVPLGLGPIDPDNPYEPLVLPGLPGTNSGTGSLPPLPQRSGLTPVPPGGMPGLEAPNTSRDLQSSSPAGSGRSSASPARGGVAPGLKAEDVPFALPRSPSDSRGAAGGLDDSPATGSSGSSHLDRLRGSGTGSPGSSPGRFDPNRGAPPPLSELARLAGVPASPSAGGSGMPSSLTSAPPPFGIPVPPPSMSAGDFEAGSGSESGPTRGGGPTSGQAGTGPAGRRSPGDPKKPLTIDVPFELVVACGPEGVVIHPGGYRLSAKALKSKDNLLMKDLKTIVQTRRQVDPSIHPRPSIRFLVEPGGAETYGDARRQTMMSGQDWPVALQISDSDILDNLGLREPF